VVISVHEGSLTRLRSTTSSHSIEHLLIGLCDLLRLSLQCLKHCLVLVELPLDGVHCLSTVQLRSIRALQQLCCKSDEAFMIHIRSDRSLLTINKSCKFFFRSKLHWSNRRSFEYSGVLFEA